MKNLKIPTIFMADFPMLQLIVWVYLKNGGCACTMHATPNILHNLMVVQYWKEQYSGSKTLTLIHFQTEDRHRRAGGPVHIISVTLINLDKLHYLLFLGLLK